MPGLGRIFNASHAVMHWYLREYKMLESSYVKQKHYSEDEEYLTRFRDINTEILISLYKDIQYTHYNILKVLETASATETFYFSADARNCQSTLAAIRSILFSRGVREFPEYEGDR